MPIVLERRPPDGGGQIRAFDIAACGEIAGIGLIPNFIIFRRPVQRSHNSPEIRVPILQAIRRTERRIAPRHGSAGVSFGPGNAVIQNHQRLNLTLFQVRQERQDLGEIVPVDLMVPGENTTPGYLDPNHTDAALRKQIEAGVIILRHARAEDGISGPRMAGGGTKRRFKAMILRSNRFSIMGNARNRDAIVLSLG